MKRIIRPTDDVSNVRVEMSPAGDAAEWMIGELRWRMSRAAARWELYRVGLAVEVLEGRFRAMDDAVAYSLGWCRGLANSTIALGELVADILGEDFGRAPAGSPPAGGKGVCDGK